MRGSRFGLLLALTVIFTAGKVYGEGFTRLIKLPNGAIGNLARAFASDMDNDGYMEFGMYCQDEVPTFAGWQIWRCIPPDSFVLVKQESRVAGDTTNPGSMIPWDVGDVDSDGRSELVGYTSSDSPDYVHLVQTVEAEDGFSLPSDVNWMDAYESGVAYFATPFYLSELDRDGKTDIVFLAYGFSIVVIYENVANDDNRMVWTDTVGDEGLQLNHFVWGDFDGDSLTEFVSGDWRASDFVVWEHTGADNDYQRVYQGKVEDEDAGAADVFGGEDMDGDGSPEFFFNVHWGMGNTDMELWRYYAVGDNTYEGERVDTTPSAYVGGVLTSDVGDVDGDGLLEVVWCQGSRIMLLDDALHGYQRLGEWYADHTGYSAQLLVTCADLTLDGADEIIVTGCFRTSILKWEGVGVAEEPVGDSSASWLVLSPIGSRIVVRYTNHPGGFHAYVYDSIGRKVDELHSNQTQGTISWGECYGPGVYFIRELSEGTSNKVVLVR